MNNDYAGYFCAEIANIDDEHGKSIIIKGFEGIITKEEGEQQSQLRV